MKDFRNSRSMETVRTVATFPVSGTFENRKQTFSGDMPPVLVRFVGLIAKGKEWAKTLKKTFFIHHLAHGMLVHTSWEKLFLKRQTTFHSAKISKTRGVCRS